MPSVIGMAAMRKSPAFTEDSPPMSQKVIAGSLLFGSARNLVIDIKAEKRLETTIPVRTRARVPLFPPVDCAGDCP